MSVERTGQQSVATEKVTAEVDSVEPADQWSDEYWDSVIRIFKPILRDFLMPSHLLIFLTSIKEVRDAALKIHRKENKGDLPKAADTLLDALIKSEQPGKWRMFFDAVREVKDTVILQILFEEKPSKDDPCQDHERNVQLINVYTKLIKKHLQLGELLLQKMVDKELIRHEDEQRLKGLLQERKDQEAIAVLLVMIHRHNSSWFKIFMTILYESDEHKKLALEIDPEFCLKLEKSQSKESSGASGEGSVAESVDENEREQTVKANPRDDRIRAAREEREATNSCSVCLCNKTHTEVLSLKSEVLSLTSEVLSLKSTIADLKNLMERSQQHQ